MYAAIGKLGLLLGRTWGGFPEVLKGSWLHLHPQTQARLLKAVSTSLWPNLSNCFTFNMAKSWKSSGSWRLWLHCRCLALLSMMALGAGSEAPTALLDTAVSIVALPPTWPSLEGWQHVPQPCESHGPPPALLPLPPPLQILMEVAC